MQKLKVLVTGGGLLGQFINIEFNSHFDLLTTYHTTSGNCSQFASCQLDITDENAVSKIFNSFRPDVVVHTAAISNPASALKLPAKKVFAVNVLATEFLAKLCKTSGAKLLYLSTDLVYAGYRGSFLSEDAKIAPISLYAETKFMGEQKIKSVFENFIILRTALMYGISHTARVNHFHEMYHKLSNGELVSLFPDQYRTPLALFDAARILRQLTSSNIAGQIINFGGVERVSRYELGEALCDAAGFNKNLLQKISMEDLKDYPSVADVSMNTEKLIAYGLIPLTIEKSIQHILKELRK